MEPAGKLLETANYAGMVELRCRLARPEGQRR